jgi:hypothetical protein
MPCPERPPAEAHRVLRQGGRIAIFDGDYATTTVAIGEHDPLQVAADATLLPWSMTYGSCAACQRW